MVDIALRPEHITLSYSKSGTVTVLRLFDLNLYITPNLTPQRADSTPLPGAHKVTAWDIRLSVETEVLDATIALLALGTATTVALAATNYPDSLSWSLTITGPLGAGTQKVQFDLTSAQIDDYRLKMERGSDQIRQQFTLKACGITATSV